MNGIKDALQSVRTWIALGLGGAIMLAIELGVDVTNLCTAPGAGQ